MKGQYEMNSEAESRVVLGGCYVILLASANDRADIRLINTDQSQSISLPLLSMDSFLSWDNLLGIQARSYAIGFAKEHQGHRSRTVPNDQYKSLV
jgi:hypothetical protein